MGKWIQIVIVYVSVQVKLYMVKILFLSILKYFLDIIAVLFS